MKVAILLLAAVVCFAAVNAVHSEQPDLINLDLLIGEDFADEITEFDSRGVRTGFFRTVKAVLRTLKGVNCSIKYVIAIKQGAQDLIQNIQSCGTDAVKAFKHVITAAQSVIATCDEIIHINQKVCNNDESTDGKSKTPFSCFIKLLLRFVKLKRQTTYALNAIKKVPAVPEEVAICTNKAVNEFKSMCTSFPSNVKECSKLTS